MDGHPLSSPRSAPRRMVAAALALLAIAAGAGTALADDAPVTTPAVRWPATGTGLHTATTLAVQRWGFSPCRGRVTVTWTLLSAGLNAQSSWTNDVDPYGQPSRNADCAVELSTRTDWDWPKLCSVVVHELGHLAGHDHVDDPQDVMYFTYMHPLPECVATPEPVEITPGPPTAGPGPVPTATPRRAVKAKAKAKAEARTPVRGTARKQRTKHPRRRR